VGVERRGTMTTSTAVSRSAQNLLAIDQLSVCYGSRRKAGSASAVDQVTLAIQPGRTLGLVGESGSGKTTLGRAVLGIVPPESGRIIFDGRDITSASKAERRALSARLQVVFQNPYGSLSPTRTVRQIIGEMLTVHQKLSKAEVNQKVSEALESVGLPEGAADRYPHEFSGGQRQRIAIARALINSPELVICDEPVSALDLSIQAQILNLLKAQQDKLGTSYLFIAHNLAVVRHMAQDIAVMFRGRIVESGPAKTVYERPAHPYSQALLAAAPIADPELQRVRRKAFEEARQPPRPGQASGCPYVRRCVHAAAQCWSEVPELVVSPTGSRAACLRLPEIPPASTAARLPAPAEPSVRSPQSSVSDGHSPSVA
jgi:oligopeptide/dipeptide ABC transporter ATP-binding protein